MKQFSCSALRWVECILQERFGHTFIVSPEGSALVLALEDSEREIRFDNLQSVFQKSDSEFPCEHWQASTEGYTAPIDDIIPAPSETELTAPLIEVNEQGATIHYDILGLTYWMLTRMEELRGVDLDSHSRFPATSSHAYKHAYLERPIVDEWMIILGQVIRRVWPALELKKHKFSIKVSHDVDSPSMYAFKTWSEIGRMMVGDLIKRRDLKAFLNAPYVKITSKNELHKLDPFNTFDWLMDISDANGINSAFYFICGRTERDRDSDYEPEHPAIRKLMRRIHQRGHEIGLHPSYGTFQHPVLIKQEAERLWRICSEEGIDQEQWGGRMHYLRWEQPTTLLAWDAAGMTYDSTLGYADRAGFRCGTCHEYPAFDPKSEKQCRLRIRPLVVMETTVISDQYMGLGAGEESEEKIKKIKDSCALVSGDFTLLWHNSKFLNPRYMRLYKNILTAN
ncbi:MAG: polysaccharide deacetylase family protein [Marinobacter adhaerens]